MRKDFLWVGRIHYDITQLHRIYRNTAHLALSSFIFCSLMVISLTLLLCGSILVEEFVKELIIVPSYNDGHSLSKVVHVFVIYLVDLVLLGEHRIVNFTSLVHVFKLLHLINFERLIDHTFRSSDNGLYRYLATELLHVMWFLFLRCLLCRCRV